MATEPSCRDRATTSELERVTVRVPASLLATVDAWVEEDRYPTRSAALRAVLARGEVALTADGGET